MSLPSSGTISFSNINTELGNAATSTLPINETCPRYIANVPTSGTTISMSNFYGKSFLKQQLYDTAGTHTFLVPGCVNSICVLCVGKGANQILAGGPAVSPLSGRGGGALSYSNNISVTPGESLTVVIGTDSYIQRSSTNLVLAKGGSGSTGGQASSGVGQVKYSGGNGGSTSTYGGGGGGGAAGYSGGGGSGNGANGSGGSGASGQLSLSSAYGGGGGGGVGLLGEGSSGVASIYNSQGGGGGSGGANGANGYYVSNGGDGGNYGGGGGGYSESSGGTISTGVPGKGAVRIIWGGSRAFPSTNTGDL